MIIKQQLILEHYIITNNITIESQKQLTKTL